MKEVLMMLLPDCPYCHQADRMLKQLMEENPRYRQVPIRRVDESVEAAFADSMDYYYVPTFYVDGQKLHEGVPTKQAVEAVFRAAAQ